MLVMPYVLAGDFLGIVVPKQLRGLAELAGGGGSINATLACFGVKPDCLKTQLRLENLTFDSSTGSAVLALNLSNPFIHQRTVISKLNFTLVNGTRFLAVELAEPVVLEANWTGTVSLLLSSDNPEALGSLVEALRCRPESVMNLEIRDLHININGVEISVQEAWKACLEGGRR